MEEEFNNLVESGHTTNSSSSSNSRNGKRKNDTKLRDKVKLRSFLFFIQGLIVGLTLAYFQNYRDSKCLLSSISQDLNPDMSTTTYESSLEDTLCTTNENADTMSVHLTKEFDFDATTNTNTKKVLTKDQALQLKQNGSIFHLQASKQDYPFFACNAPKTGCTGWKHFYWYLNHDKIVYDGTETSLRKVHADGKAIHSDFQKSLTVQEYQSLFQSTKHKIVIARNPYVRFLSSYKDYLKARSRKSEQDLPFIKFLQLFEKNRHELETGSKTCGKGHKCPINHIESVSKSCSAGFVGGYTVLRVEQQYAWYDAYLDYFGLTPVMEEYTTKGGPLLFESGSEYKITKDGILVNPEQSKKFDSPHNRNAAGQLMDYYTSKDIVDRVTHLFMDDFINFGYPLWDGRAETFREA